MLDSLKSAKSENYDAYFFIPGPEDDTVRIEGCKYKVPGEDIGGSEMGHMYHIMLFKEDDEGVYAEDLFEAILVEPLEYISNLIPQDWYGLIARKTTTSTDFVEDTFDNLRNV